MSMKHSVLWGMLVASATVGAQEAAIVGSAQQGAAKVQMCVGCHSIAGYQASFPQVHKVPMISGQSKGYIVAALEAYRRGDRAHPTMRGVTQMMSVQDVADVAAFYSEQVGTPGKPAHNPPANVQALIDKGACLSCHGEGFAKPIDASYPKVAGQHADYLYVALKAYKTGAHPHTGRTNPIMVGIAQQFTLPELKQLASYISGLDGELQTLPQPRFR